MFMISMKWVELIAKVICKIMKLSSHFCEFILPKKYVPTLIWNDYVLCGRSQHYLQMSRVSLTLNSHMLTDNHCLKPWTPQGNQNLHIFFFVVGPPITAPKAEGILTPNWDTTITYFPRATSLEHSWTKLPWFMLLALPTNICRW